MVYASIIKYVPEDQKISIGTLYMFCKVEKIQNAGRRERSSSEVCIVFKMYYKSNLNHLSLAISSQTITKGVFCLD